MELIALHSGGGGQFMQGRIIHGAVSVLAVLGTTAVVSAQAPAAPQRLAHCLTPVTTTEVYFDVPANGPTRRLLRMVADAPREKVTHSVGVRLRGQGAAPALLTPQRVVEAVPARTHRHESLYTFSTTDIEADTADVLIGSAIGSTGCRLRLAHTRHTRLR
jgi:hypothetical protein